MAETDGSETRWWPLDLARYAVVSAVTVVAVMVIVTTMPMVFRPEQVRLVLVQGSVYVDPFPVLPPPNLTLRFTVMAYNPTKFDINYTDVKVQLLDVASSQQRVFHFSIEYPLRIESLEWMYYGDQEIALPHAQVPDRYVSLFYDKGNVNVAMQLEGLLTTSTQSGRIAEKKQVRYYCWPVTLGYGSSSDIDVSCPQVHSND